MDTIDNYIEFANELCKRVYTDYVNDMFTIKKLERIEIEKGITNYQRGKAREAQSDKYVCENFFESEFFRNITHVSGDYLMDKAKEHAQRMFKDWMVNRNEKPKF